MDWIGITGWMLTVVGALIAVYEFAIIRQNNKQWKKAQYALASISNISLTKVQGMDRQIKKILRSPDLATTSQLLLMYERSRDEMTEIHQAAIALEGLFDSDQSASRKLLEDILENTKINNAIQAEGLKNPSLEQKNEK